MSVWPNRKAAVANGWEIEASHCKGMRIRMINTEWKGAWLRKGGPSYRFIVSTEVSILQRDEVLLLEKIGTDNLQIFFNVKSKSGNNHVILLVTSLVKALKHIVTSNWLNISDDQEWINCPPWEGIQRRWSVAWWPLRCDEIPEINFRLSMEISVHWSPGRPLHRSSVGSWQTTALRFWNSKAASFCDLTPSFFL